MAEQTAMKHTVIMILVQLHLAEYPEELKSYVCPKPRAAETEVVTHCNLKAYRKKEILWIK